MNIQKLIVKKILPTILPSPVKVRHAQYSMIYSADDDNSHSSKYLVSLALDAIRNAQGISLEEVSKRLKYSPYYPDVWPGEHYKLLSGLVVTLKPQVIIEIGTYTGLSALAMKYFLPENGKIYTFDIIKWDSISDTCLLKDDFKDGKLIQYVDDLTDQKVIGKYGELLSHADLIFIDAEKDGVMEQVLIENFKRISFKKKPLMVFDDIRVWNMMKIWRDISMPKLDLTSFGHWAGTGMVEWIS